MTPETPLDGAAAPSRALAQEERLARDQLEAVLAYIRREATQQPLLEVQRGVLRRLVVLASSLSRCLSHRRELPARDSSPPEPSD